jgi:hypothetical protein
VRTPELVKTEAQVSAGNAGEVDTVRGKTWGNVAIRPNVVRGPSAYRSALWAVGLVAAVLAAVSLLGLYRRWRLA